MFCEPSTFSDDTTTTFKQTKTETDNPIVISSPSSCEQHEHSFMGKNTQKGADKN